MLECHLLNLYKKIRFKIYFSQQDNVLIYIAITQRSNLKNYNSTIDCPVNSPDLNSVTTLWCITQ